MLQLQLLRSIEDQLFHLEKWLLNILEKMVQHYLVLIKN